MEQHCLNTMDNEKEPAIIKQEEEEKRLGARKRHLENEKAVEASKSIRMEEIASSEEHKNAENQIDKTQSTKSMTLRSQRAASGNQDWCNDLQIKEMETGGKRLQERPKLNLKEDGRGNKQSCHVRMAFRPRTINPKLEETDSSRGKNRPSNKATVPSSNLLEPEPRSLKKQAAPSRGPSSEEHLKPAKSNIKPHKLKCQNKQKKNVKTSRNVNNVAGNPIKAGKHPKLINQKKSTTIQNEATVPSPLYLAIENNDVGSVKNLLATGASNANEWSPGRVSPLVAAIRSDAGVEMVEALIGHGANTDEVWYNASPVMLAIDRGQVDVVEMLLRSGADPDKAPLLHTRPTKRELPSGQPGATAHGADSAKAKKKELLYETPLMLSVRTDQMDMAMALLRHGADVNKTNLFRKSPLLLAIKTKSQKMLDFLLERGADVSKTDLIGQTPLFYAIRHGNHVAVEQLIERGAELNAIDVLGETPLLQAIQLDQSRSAMLLVRSGCGVDQENREGECPLSLALTYGEMRLARALLERGARTADVFAKACENGDARSVELLLKYSADRACCYDD